MIFLSADIDLPVLVAGDQRCWTERRLRSETHRQHRSVRAGAPFLSRQVGGSKHVSYECNISVLRYCDFRVLNS